MARHMIKYIASMNTNDAFIFLGFCPEVVRTISLGDGQETLWCRLMGTDGGLERVAAGDRTLRTDKGIKLVQFTETPLKTTSDPTEIDPSNWHDANGIQITADALQLADDDIVLVEAWGMDDLWIKGVHDGGASGTFAQDSSFDFQELGVSGGQLCILYNQNNGDYAYVKDVVKPAGQSKKCRLTLAEDVSGTATTAAALADADVFYVFPVSAAWYPMSDIGLMS